MTEEFRPIAGHGPTSITPAVLSGLFLAMIPASNWLIGHVGTVCLSDAGPCLVPVAPGLLAPSGSLTIGVALLLRNALQLIVPRWWVLVLIVCGALLSATVAPPALALASGAAFTLGELSDWAVFSPLRRRHLTWAIIMAGGAGAVVDAFVFITIAFGSEYWLMPGQVVAKVWASLMAAGLLWGWWLVDHRARARERRKLAEATRPLRRPTGTAAGL